MRRSRGTDKLGKCIVAKFPRKSVETDTFVCEDLGLFLELSRLVDKGCSVPKNPHIELIFRVWAIQHQ